jgi:hypothetical protein
MNRKEKNNNNIKSLNQLEFSGATLALARGCDDPTNGHI